MEAPLPTVQSHFTSELSLISLALGHIQKSATNYLNAVNHDK